MTPMQPPADPVEYFEALERGVRAATLSCEFWGHVEAKLVQWAAEYADLAERMPEDVLPLIARKVKKSPEWDQETAQRGLVTIAAFALLGWLNAETRRRPPLPEFQTNIRSIRDRYAARQERIAE